jgi:hypothetical protein
VKTWVPSGRVIPAFGMSTRAFVSPRNANLQSLGILALLVKSVIYARVTLNTAYQNEMVRKVKPAEGWLGGVGRDAFRNVQGARLNTEGPVFWLRMRKMLRVAKLCDFG